MGPSDVGGLVCNVVFEVTISACVIVIVSACVACGDGCGCIWVGKWRVGLSQREIVTDSSNCKFKHVSSGCLDGLLAWAHTPGIHGATGTALRTCLERPYRP